MFPYIFFRSCLQGYGIKKLKRSQDWPLKINYSFFTDKGIAEKEMEALLIHEYHHVCRLHHLKKDQKELHSP